MRKVERRRADGAHAERHLAALHAAGRVAREALKGARLHVHHLLRAVGAPLKRQERLLQRRQRLGLREGERAALGVQRRRHKRAAAFACRVQLAHERRKDHTDHRLGLVDESDRDAHEREALHKVGRPVDRVDDPRRRIGDLGLLARRPALLTDKLVVGEARLDRLAHELLRVLVGLGHEIRRVLLLVESGCVS